MTYHQARYSSPHLRLGSESELYVSKDALAIVFARYQRFQQTPAVLDVNELCRPFERSIY